jgi:hypothetical protein
MKAKSYVGITGPVSAEEVENICNEFHCAGYSMDSPHVPMLGFLMSYKTLNGASTKNKRYPLADIVPRLLKTTEGRTFNMIHYNSREIDTLSDQVSRIFDGIYEDGLCRSMQLNINWPDVGQISKIMDQYPDMKIVFQASHKAMEDMGPKDVASKIKDYEDIVSYVLIDPSGGRGIPFDLESSVAIYSEIKGQCPSLAIGFAGGFDGNNVNSRLHELIRKTGDSDFCIDAEGGLRDKISSAYGDDLLNIEKVRHYLQSASSILK